MKVPLRSLPQLAAFAVGTGVLLYGAAPASLNAQQGKTASPAEAEFFENNVRPVLAANCFGCHGADMQAAGLRLDTQQGVLKGGGRGAAISPGSPDKSLLIQAVRHNGELKMPPSKKLSAKEIESLEAWIRMEAPWPKGVTSSSAANLWSLKPIANPPIPPIKGRDWVKNPIDAFVLAVLEREKLKPAPPADRRTLIRRVYYDLIGLPPKAEQVEAFLADKSPAAYEKVVDELLASPRYGERWARHWLDVARYADTKGYVFEEDRVYHHAYTYRNWVINALNRDLPYDEFIVQQIAADKLPEIVNGDDKSSLAALGFLTIGRRFLNNSHDIIDDRIDVVTRGFQGFSVACARCHDHKFDPIPTQDYYSLYGVFASSQESTLPISPGPIRDPWIAHNERVSQQERAIREVVLLQTGRLRTLAANADAQPQLTPEVKQALQMLREGAVAEGGVLAKLEPHFELEAQNKLAEIRRALEDLRKSAPPTPEFAVVLTDRQGGRDGVVFKRGNPSTPGEPAPRRFLAALSPPGKERPLWKNGSGRLDLAKAIASKDNPLTARVFVNRAWQHHFGAGIVRTASDFGFQGEKPTHPQLLDYLAYRFMQEGWSIKKLHRLIVTSATYRQASTVDKSTFNRDPENKLLTRMNRRRLDLEQMRDSLMWAAGSLDTKQLGGKSVDLWSQPFNPRRAVYGFIERQNLPGIFRTFDFASPDTTSAQRYQTSVPQQALFLMNSPLVVEQSLHLSEVPEIRAAANTGQLIRRLYRRLFGRMPDASELKLGEMFLNLPDPPPQASAWTYGHGTIGADGKVTDFKEFPHFGNNVYAGGPKLPDPALGFLMLGQAAGHPGGTRAVVRRWIAPVATSIDIFGALQHGQKEGDGVRASIVSNLKGSLGSWKAHEGKAETNLFAVAVKKGEVLDFVVDCVGNESHDSFSWSPSLRTADGQATWDAGRDFGPPPPPALTRRAMYIQSLLICNEFMFID